MAMTHMPKTTATTSRKATTRKFFFCPNCVLEYEHEEDHRDRTLLAPERDFPFAAAHAHPSTAGEEDRLEIQRH